MIGSCTDLNVDSGVKRNFWPLRKFWPVIMFHLFCFPEQRNKVWQLLFWCVLCKLKHFGCMSGTHNKLYHSNNFKHWKFSDLVIDLNYFSFSHPNPTHLPKHKSLSPNNQFYHRVSSVKYYSVHAYMVWSPKFRKSEILLDTGSGSNLKYWFRHQLQPKMQTLAGVHSATLAPWSSLPQMQRQNMRNSYAERTCHSFSNSASIKTICRQAHNQLRTPGGAKSFLRGTQIF